MSKHFRICFIAVALLALGMPSAPKADVNISVGLGAPPPLMIPYPPSVLVIPGTYAYFVPDVQVDILFYQGYWYRPHGEYWYTSTHYNGPWNYIAISRVPQVLIGLPSGFRRVNYGQELIPYGKLKSYWKSWEKERHWDKREREEHHYKEAKQKRKDHGVIKGKGKH